MIPPGFIPQTMTNKTKQRLRYMQADRRITARRWPTDPTERELCQLDADREQITKDIDRIFNDMHGRGFRPGIDNSNPLFFTDFDLINELTRRRERIARKVERLEKKVGISTLEALQVMYRMNTGRGSQSF